MHSHEFSLYSVFPVAACFALWRRGVNILNRSRQVSTGLLFLCTQVDAVIGADGANSRVAKEIDAGEYDYAIAFQERIRIPDDKMDYYKDLAEMYVGDDVSPDFYGWVFPKYDHVAVGTGTVVNKTAIKQYQQATRDRSKVCCASLPIPC